MSDNEKAKFYFNRGIKNMLDADSLAHQGRMDEAYAEVYNAINSYDQAIKENPGEAIFYSAKGFSLAQLGATLDAAELFEKSIELDPRLTESYYQLSLCFLEYDLIESGHDAFEEALALYENKVDLKLRYYEDLINMINRHIFYRDDLIKMGHLEHIPEMTKKIVKTINYAKTLDFTDSRLDVLLKSAEYNVQAATSLATSAGLIIYGDNDWAI